MSRRIAGFDRDRSIGRKCYLRSMLKVVIGFILGAILVLLTVPLEEAYEEDNRIYDRLISGNRDGVSFETNKVLELLAIERFRYWWFGRYSPLDLVFQRRDSTAVYSLEVCEPLNLYRWDRGVYTDIGVNEPMFFYMVGNPWHGTCINGEEIKKFYRDGEDE